MKKRKIYDLSWPFCRNLPTYAMSVKFYNPPLMAAYNFFDQTPYEKRDKRGNWQFFDSVVTFFTHSGSHLDAPIHCSQYTKAKWKKGKQWSIEQIPLDYVWGEAVVVSIPKGELEEITPKDLENATPKIKKGDIVVMNTGWHKNFAGPLDGWEKAMYYAQKNPGMGHEGAEYLIKLGIKVIMADYLGVDHPKYTERGDNSWPCHGKFLGNNIPMVQNIGNQIDEVTGKRCQICYAPVPLLGGDGFPVRVLAMVEE